MSESPLQFLTPLLPFNSFIWGAPSLSQPRQPTQDYPPQQPALQQSLSHQEERLSSPRRTPAFSQIYSLSLLHAAQPMSPQKPLLKSVFLLLVSRSQPQTQPQQRTLELASNLPSPGSKQNVSHISAAQPPHWFPRTHCVHCGEAWKTKTTTAAAPD